MMELRPVGVGGVLAVLGNAIRSETGAQVAALREAVEHAHICGLEETVPAYALAARQIRSVSDRLRRALRHAARAGAADFRLDRNRG